jgi:hypothetical protein
MDWESKGNFSKDLSLEETWDLKIWFDLIVDNLSNPYPDKWVVNVRDNIKIAIYGICKNEITNI